MLEILQRYKFRSKDSSIRLMDALNKKLDTRWRVYPIHARR